MSKISELEHISVLMNGVNLDGWRDLQKGKIVKESTGSRPVWKSPMLKSDYFA